jgi:hypothetical protein
VFILQLQNYANEGMLWCLESVSSYFVVDGFILLFMTLVELLGLVDAFFVVYESLVFVLSL